jgi:predicted ATPase
MYALWHASIPQIECGNYATAGSQLDEAIALADEKGSVHWKALATVSRGWVFALTGDASKAIQVMMTGIVAFRSTGLRAILPLFFSQLGWAYAKLGLSDDARRSISEAMSAMAASKEAWFEAEVHRIGGEIALMRATPDMPKAEEYFERALTAARRQEEKSWELRAATSMARLWRDQGKRDEARDLLAPVYGWFTEGFDTRDLKEAKVLLDELTA